MAFRMARVARGARGARGVCVTGRAARPAGVAGPRRPLGSSPKDREPPLPAAAVAEAAAAVGAEDPEKTAAAAAAAAAASERVGLAADEAFERLAAELSAQEAAEAAAVGPKAAEAAAAAVAAADGEGAAAASAEDVTDEYPPNPFEWKGLTIDEAKKCVVSGWGRVGGMATGAAIGVGSWYGLEPMVPVFASHELATVAAWTVPSMVYWGGVGRVLATSMPIRYVNFDKHLLTAPMYKALASVPPVMYSNMVLTRDAKAIEAASRVAVKCILHEFEAIEQTLAEGDRELIGLVIQRNKARFASERQLQNLFRRALLELAKGDDGERSGRRMPGLVMDMLDRSLNRTAVLPIGLVALVFYGIVGGSVAGLAYYFSK